MAPGGYLWWYVDALSDDGRHGLTIITFVGSVFSPYYARAFRRHGAAVNPEDHCAVNVCLYGQGARRWTMTERGHSRLQRGPHDYVLGPSALHWDGNALTYRIDEVSLPLPQRVRGTVRVVPEALCRFSTALDAAGRHRWGPIAPCARVEVELQSPALRWRGHAYLDSNEGDEPVTRAFDEWDWSRGTLAGGDTAVIYDVRPRAGAERVIARRFTPDGRAEPFEPPPRQPLPRTAWRLRRTMRSDPGTAPAVLQSLEDTPFYARAVVRSALAGEPVVSVHETLDVRRLGTTVVQGMLPFRMPRRA